MDLDCDVAVLGAGPAGLTAGIYLARAGLKAVLLEKLAPGGQAATTDVIENYPGFQAPVGGFRLTENMRQQAQTFGADIRTGEALGIEEDPAGGGKRIRLKDETLRARAVVVATGAGYAKLGVPGEDRYWGKGISCCATCDGMFYRGKQVVVVGGGDTAVQEALFLTKFARKITLVHRRDRLRAAKPLQDRLRSHGDQVAFVWNTVVEEIEGSAHVEGVRLRDLDTGETSRMGCNGVFVFVGFTPNTAFLKGTLDLDARGYILTDETMATSHRGIWAAGDCRKRPFRQVVTACGEGAVAAHEVDRFLGDVVPEATDTDFGEIAGRGLSLVLAWKSSSEEAQQEASRVESIAPRFEGRATFCRLNLDAGKETAGRYGIHSCPTLLLLRDGKEIKRVEGVCSEGEIEAVLEEARSEGEG